MASVAGRLTATGIPAILAMTHSVLVATTTALFGHFYQQPGQGPGHRQRAGRRPRLARQQPGEVRGPARRGPPHARGSTTGSCPRSSMPGPTPRCSPATPRQDPAPDPAAARAHNLRPAHEAGFFGRRRELWQIERWFAGRDPAHLHHRLRRPGQDRAGPGGRALAAAHRALRARRLRRLSPRSSPTTPLGVAVSTIGAVLGETLADAAAAGRALGRRADPGHPRQPGDRPAAGTRPNCSTPPRPGPRRARPACCSPAAPPTSDHPDYRIQGTRVHRRIALDGLGSAAYPDDALDWFAALRPPARGGRRTRRSRRPAATS